MQSENSIPSSGCTRLTRLQWLGVIWLALFFITFWWDTRDVRHANSDDVEFESVVQSSGVLEYTSTLSRQQGRFYMPIAFGPITALYRIEPPLIFSAARTLVLLAQFFAAGWLFSHLSRSRDVGLLLCVCAALLLQVPMCYNGALSYPQTGLGFVLTCVGLRFALVESSGGLSWPLAFSAFIACCMNEAFVAPLLLSVLLGRVWLKRWTKQHLALGLGVSLYVGCYLWFRVAFASTYSGSSLDPGLAAVRSCLVQLASTAPGFEILVNRYGFEPGPFLKTAPQIQRILSGPSLLHLGLIASGAGLVLLLHRRLKTTPVLPKATQVAGLAVLALAFAITMSLTPKYQVWAYQRQYPYVYSLYSWFVLLGLLVWLSAARPATNLWRQVFFGSVMAIASLLCWSSNLHVFKSLEQHPYPWPGDMIRAIDRRTE